MSNKCLHFVKQLFSLFSLLSKVQYNTKKDLENLKPLFFVCICQNMFIYSYRLKENVLYFEACPADLFGSNYSVLSFLLFRISLMNVKNGQIHRSKPPLITKQELHTLQLFTTRFIKFLSAASEKLRKKKFKNQNKWFIQLTK